MIKTVENTPIANERLNESFNNNIMISNPKLEYSYERERVKEKYRPRWLLMVQMLRTKKYVHTYCRFYAISRSDEKIACKSFVKDFIADREIIKRSIYIFDSRVVRNI
jgi:hypothetical protein